MSAHPFAGYAFSDARCWLIRDTKGRASALSIRPVELTMIPTGWSVEESTIGESVRLLLAAIGRPQS